MDYWNTFLAWYILSPNEISNNYEFKQSMNTLQCNTETFRMQIDSQRQNQAVINSLDARNWYDTPCYEVERSVKVTDNIIETETSLIPHDIKCESSCNQNTSQVYNFDPIKVPLPREEVKEESSIFEKILLWLEDRVNELNDLLSMILE